MFLADDKHCHKSVEHCVEVHTDSITNGIIRCKKCSEKYYIVNDECNPGLDNGGKCKEYFSEQNKCKKCENNYYMNNSICQDVTPIDQCDSYNESENSCKSCLFNHSLFKLKNKCVEAVPNCERYESNKVICEKCEPMYRLENKLCVNYNIENCEAANDDGCTKCSENYGLVKKNGKNSCDKYLSQLKTNCYKLKDDQYNFHRNSKSCEICEENRIWTDVEYHCLTDAQIDTDENLSIKIENFSNCDVYGKDVCLKCKKEFYLKNNECVKCDQSNESMLLYTISNNIATRNTCETSDSVSVMIDSINNSKQ